MKNLRRNTRFLKQLDMNKETVHLQFGYWDYNNNKVQYNDHIGTRIGGGVTIFAFILGLSIFFYQTINLFQPSNINISWMHERNYFKGPTQEIYIKDHIFLPSIYIYAKQSLKVFDILKTEDSNVELNQSQNDFSIVNLDLAKLSKYFTIYLEQQDSQLNRQSKYQRVLFEKCTPEHFLTQNFTMDANTKSKINKRYCPILGSNYNKFSVKNEYTNEVERKNFGVKINKCEGNGCADNEMIDKLLKNIIFTLYVTTGFSEIGKLNDHKTPVVPLDQQHSQFQLDINQYRDSNNQLRINKIEIMGDQFKAYPNPQEFHFIDMIKDSAWVGEVFNYHHNVSYDGGTTWSKNLTNDTVLFATHFFLSPQIIKYKNEVNNILDLLADLGGLAEAFAIMFGFISHFLNKDTIMKKVVKSLYFLEKEQDDQEKNILEKKKTIKGKMFKYQKEDILFKLGKQRFQKEMNVVQLYQTIQKLKAAVSVIIGNDREKRFKVQMQYMDDATIYFNKQQQDIQKLNKNVITKFLERDERDIFKGQELGLFDSRKDNWLKRKTQLVKMDMLRREQISMVEQGQLKLGQGRIDSSSLTNELSCSEISNNSIEQFPTKTEANPTLSELNPTLSESDVSNMSKVQDINHFEIRKQVYIPENPQNIIDVLRIENVVR